MTLQVPYPGAGLAAEYQVSGIPYLSSSTIGSGSEARFDFPFVTRNISFKNLGPSDIRLGVTSNGVHGTNYFLVQSGSQHDAMMRTKQLYIYNPSGATTSYSLYAGLTCIPERNFPILTGSTLNLTGSGGQQGVG